jgi:hypothetical protein
MSNIADFTRPGILKQKKNQVGTQHALQDRTNTSTKRDRQVLGNMTSVQGTGPVVLTTEKENIIGHTSKKPKHNKQVPDLINGPLLLADNQASAHAPNNRLDDELFVAALKIIMLPTPSKDEISVENIPQSKTPVVASKPTAQPNSLLSSALPVERQQAVREDVFDSSKSMQLAFKSQIEVEGIDHLLDAPDTKKVVSRSSSSAGPVQLEQVAAVDDQELDPNLDDFGFDLEADDLERLFANNGPQSPIVK